MHRREATIRDVENITHSLVGATLAELALPASATRSQRRLFFAAGIIAANLPDADLLYTRITTAPLGYLLHHRGHTHTVAGLLVQAAIIGLIALLPAVRQRIGASRPRFALLIGAGLVSHLVLDSWNSYGVHPFWPIDNRWYYGDAIYIVEPWLWLFFGVAAAMNAQSARARGVVGALLSVLAMALAWFGMIGVSALVALVIVATGAVLLLTRLTPRARSLSALLATSAFVISMFGVRTDIEQRALASLAPTPSAQVLDIVLSPQPANPLCWTALAIVKDQRAGDYVMTRGSVPFGGVAHCGGAERGRVTWTAPVRQSLANLRGLVRSDCRVRAWMQFGRAPVIGEGAIADVRFGQPARGNFSAMSLAADDAGCPANLTAWSVPRADLLE